MPPRPAFRVAAVPGEAAESIAAVAQRLDATTSTVKVQPPPPATSLAWEHSPDSASRPALTPDSIDKRQSQTQLHYFHILKEAVDDGALNDQNDKTGTPFDPDDDGQPWHGAPQLDDVDKEYLNKKRVFDLPPKRCLIAFVTCYFATLEPYSPVFDRVDFVHRFEAGTCSLFLLYAILAASSLYVPHALIAECGFADRADTQAAFASRAALLYDFQVDSDDALACLQGSLLMTKVLLEHPTDKDYNYWFYNALRLATKLGLYSHLNHGGKPDESDGLYSRIAWSLYCRHVFHLVSEFRNAAYLNGLPAMKPPKLSDWSVERIPQEYQDVVPPTTSQQKVLFIAICKMAALYGGILSSIAQDPCVDLQQLMQPLDSWRISLATQLQLCHQSPSSNIHYLELIGSSYRYDATLCRLIQRQLRSIDALKSNAAKQRLRSAMLELDGVTGKLLANDMMKKVPISLMTAMPALLALHLEAALDPSESDLVHSMSRISISQTMLALHQLREIPAIKKAIPLFELILARKNLYSSSAATTSVPHVAAQCESQRPLQPDAETDDAPRGESFDSFVQEFLEYDTLGNWDFAQLDFSRLV